MLRATGILLQSATKQSDCIRFPMLDLGALGACACTYGFHVLFSGLIVDKDRDPDRMA